MGVLGGLGSVQSEHISWCAECFHAFPMGSVREVLLVDSSLWATYSAGLMSIVGGLAVIFSHAYRTLESWIVGGEFNTFLTWVSIVGPV